SLSTSSSTAGSYGICVGLAEVSSAAATDSVASPPAEERGAEARGDSGRGAPRRLSASSALVRHCARRKCCAAVVYHCTVSLELPAFSCHCASSKATMGSRVLWYKSANCAAASLLVFALRIRA